MAREHRTYTLPLAVEPAEGAWHAWCPMLLGCGAATRGATRGEALGHLRDMVGVVGGRLAEAGAPVPSAPEALDGLPAEQVAVVRVPAG